MGVWAGVGGLVALVLAWEVFWRLRGFSPWVRDDWPAWALARRSPNLKRSRAVALAGASRLQVGLCPDILTALAGRRPVMLAVDGSSPLAVLADLCDDPDFTGTIICSFMPAFLAEPGSDRDRCAKWIRKSRKMPGKARSFWRLWVRCQGTFACLSPDLTPSKLLTAVTAATWPAPHRAPMSPDRYRFLDYDRVDVDQLRRARERREQALQAHARPLPPERFAARLAFIGQKVNALAERGGRVIFLRLPSSGRVRQIEKRTWPRAAYWDRLAACRPARSVHFEDHPQLAGFECPDGSHLGREDARRFSRVLVEILQRELGVGS